MKKSSSSAKAPKSAAPKKAVVAKKPEPVAKKPKSNGNGGTEIHANVDVGFGNALYLRGEGPGINWERGVAMACLKDDLWAFTVAATARPIVFKLLINDETWCTGDDYVAAPGKKMSTAPPVPTGVLIVVSEEEGGGGRALSPSSSPPPPYPPA